MRPIARLAVAIILASLLLLPACDGGRQVHRPSSVSVVAPPGWQVYSPEEIRAAYVESARQAGVAPPERISAVMLFMKYEEPTERLNPSVHVLWTLLSGAWQSRSALELLEETVDLDTDPGLSWVEPPVATKFQGFPAARCVTRREQIGPAGKEYVFVSEMLVVHRGEDLISVQMSGAESGPDRADEEFAAVLASLDIGR